MTIYVKIKKTYGSFSLDVEFEASNGVMGLLGASGCGKSMTLKCIAGVIKPDEGIVVVDGETLFDSKKKIWNDEHEKDLVDDNNWLNQNNSHTIRLVPQKKYLICKTIK